MAKLSVRPPVLAHRIALPLVVCLWGAPAIAQDATGVPSKEYTVREGDQLRIRVWPDSMLGGIYPVEDDGAVYLPVIGRLSVAGLELSELRGDLRERFGQVLRNPTVSVTPLFRVSVLGAVQRPGLYEVTPTEGIIDAISLAGGFRDDAKEDEVKVVRDGEIIVVNSEAGREEASARRVQGLRSGDRIIVPAGWDIEIRDVLYVLQSAAILVTLIVQSQDGGS